MIHTETHALDESKNGTRVQRNRYFVIVERLVEYISD